MTDLVQRLRCIKSPTCGEAADRIEQLEATSINAANRVIELTREVMELERENAELVELLDSVTTESRSALEELKRENAELRKDTERINWLAQNFFHREMNDFDTRILGRGETSNQWVFFAPKEIQGDIRDVLDAAMQKEQS